ncbi:MAG: bifunctional diaminohydroxyphosphoribosylaminopyrimidine deaminase/5-amino-6-(5-phosphoribosylamino)uracil reductase RibD [Andreesenia angusta]|nr:bifunctional diaminohydroxyphosphoribosylaminopyrimidine deaminase/5-amino-6-(5-phosphoribosylamino)uracil reductase RibD [Andreesenia angusta]
MREEIIKYMKRAMELAEKGRGFVNPNPLVGAVIVKNGKIIGEGFHQKYGDNHAEINAFKDMKNKGYSSENADIYVTLEPCSHYGKTPPCVDAIIESDIRRVFIGLKDPNPLVSGRGIKKLKENGLEVETGILKKELEKQNEVFLNYIVNKKPFCIMKTAMSLDGKIATHNGDSKWISNEKSRKYVHKLRHSLMGIMVGVNTIIKDDPRLNTRLDSSSSDTIKIIVDSTGRIPLNSKVLNSNSDKDIIIASTERLDKKVEKELLDRGIIIIKTDSKDGRVNLNELMIRLGERKIDSILLEGGGSLNYSALESGIVDKVESFISPKIIGGRDSLTPVEGRGIDYIKEAFILNGIEIEHFDDDILIKGYLDNSYRENRK